VVSESFFTNHPDVVDWVYLELLSGDPEGATMCRRSADVGIVLSDGSVVNPIDGANPLNVVPAETGDLHVAVYHRNHLPVLSASAVTFDPPTSTTAAVDFSTSSGAAFGTNPMKKVDTSPNRFALWAANGEPDGSVQALDFNAYLTQTLAGSSGYMSGDYNMDGEVQALDFNLYLANTVVGASSQVP
jgi:hypothetical protein